MTSEELREFEIAQLQFGLSPRSDPGDDAYVQTLAERFDDLPPIVVHGATRTVIDGAHRVLAARRLGRCRIAATVFEGTAEEAVVEAVRLNVVHGKPLTLRERECAATRFLSSHPEWSDRRLAEICGLSAKTIARIRGQIVAGPREGSRVGKDGRARPTDPGSVRRRVAELLGSAPESSARKIASAAGTSQATVRDVRRRLESGEPVAPPGRVPGERLVWGDDAALRATTDASCFAQWFERTAMGNADVHVSAVPLSHVYLVVDECRTRARQWDAFATALERRARAPHPGPATLAEATAP